MKGSLFGPRMGSILPNLWLRFLQLGKINTFTLVLYEGV